VAQARAIAERLDAGADGQNFILLNRELSEVIEMLAPAQGSSGPRCGALRGDDAVVVADLLGHPEPETVDVECVDRLFHLQTRRRWRLGQWRPPVPAK
jgi:hypothetical protein